MQYYYAWDRELKTGVRAPDLGKKGKGPDEPGECFTPEGCKKTDPIMCRWPDGQEHIFSGLTVEDYEEIIKARATLKGTLDPVW